MRRITRAVTLGAVLATSCLMGVGTANAQSAEPTKAPSLVLTVAKASDSGTVRSVTLDCDPIGGTHPFADKACTDIAAAKGDIAAVRSDKPNVICTMEYNPVVVTARGTWNGRTVSYKETFSNPCVLVAQKGDFYRF